MKSTHLLETVIACLGLLVASLSHATAVSGQGTWESTLSPRDLDGNTATTEAYYDSTLNITWLANANAAVGSAYDTDIPGSGRMVWDDANAWAASLDFNGITGWRLPTVTDTGTSGCNPANFGTDCGYNVDTSTGEMASMFFDTLGDKSYYDASGTGPQPGYGLSNTGPFSNLVSSYYWSATEYAPNTAQAWGFYMDVGNQSEYGKTADYYAWAVHSGDVGVAVSSVPVPAAVWLFGSGLVGLTRVARRKNKYNCILHIQTVLRGRFHVGVNVRFCGIFAGY